MESADWDPIVNRVLAGSVDPAELPEIPQRVVRIFLSSTGIGNYNKSRYIIFFVLIVFSLVDK